MLTMMKRDYVGMYFQGGKGKWVYDCVCWVLCISEFFGVMMCVLSGGVIHTRYSKRIDGAREGVTV
jgi:hypothetical protein